MKANELRIGNWVMVFPVKNPQQVCDVMFDSVNTESVFGQHYGEVEPIQLTEEWLLKFGFISNPHSNEFYGKNMIFHNWMKDRGYISWGFTQIEYVHQLQNLYFALTGEELTYGGNK
jgi:hypothetical protein